MKTIYKKLPSNKRDCIVTIGAFDGVHLGHQFILNKVKQEAQRAGLSSLVITFDISPKHFRFKDKIRKGLKGKCYFPGYITDLRQKEILMENLGIDYLWFLKTSKSLLYLSADNFISYICRYFKISKMIVGQDFRFGYARRADKKILKKLSDKYNFELFVLGKVSKNKTVISSSLIRKCISKGELKEASRLLGRNFSLSGKIVKGRGQGIKLGFPTANVRIFNHVMPPGGVYSGYAIIGKKRYLSAINIGRNPTLTSAKKTTFEVHIINFKKNILDKEIEVVFLDKVRREKRFSSITKLKSAIQKDINLITAKYSVPAPNSLQPLVS